MEINKQLILILQDLAKYLTDNKSLIVDGKQIRLVVGTTEIMRLTTDELFLAGEHNVEASILDPDNVLPKPFPVQVDRFHKFIKEISRSKIRLNHLGIKYFSSNFNSERDKYKEWGREVGLYVYQEGSSEEGDRWYFLGDKTHWQDPLFEIVLTSKAQTNPYEWFPHFQIDIDTNLSDEELHEAADKHFWSNFFEWNIEDAEVGGIVLEMGMIGVASGTKVCVGIGTNLRSAKFHREKLLNKV